MKVDEHGGWLCAVITRGLVQVDFDMPPLVSRWNSYAFEGDTIVDLYVGEAKVRDNRYQGAKKDGEQKKVDVAKSERVS
jgi:hypothetical protein